MRVEVVLTPSEIGLLPRRDLSVTTCVVFDVLRATSTMITGLFNGARRIYPVLTIEEAVDLRETQLPQALLGGERGGQRIGGFDLGNSPREYTREAVEGRDIISTTTNGTVALRACAGAEMVLAGALLNLRALANYLTGNAAVEHLALVCAGTGESFALEDGFAAGALLALLEGRRQSSRPGVDELTLDDASVAMLALYKRWGRDPLRALRESANGRRLTEIGLDGDLEWCARESPMNIVATMRQGALEVERVPPLDV